MHHRRSSSILVVMLVCSLLFVSITMSAQTLSFLDAAGQPAVAPYLEGSRAYLRLVDPGASASASVSLSAARSGDFESLDLAETGTGTGVFEGSIELSNDFPSADGRLQTGRDTSQYPWRFDDLSATYAPGMTSAAAATVGSTVSTFDGAGASTTSYVVGDTIHLRVTDAFANSTAGVDSAPVNLSTVVGSWGEYQTVTLTETGGDTSAFTGSIQTVPGSAPIQQDGIFEVQAGSAVWVQHDDANGQTYSAVQLSIYPNLPVSLAFVDAWGQPAESYPEFGSVQIRATDGALAGQWWGLTVRITSDLRGDEEYVPLNENPFFSGIFTGSVTLRGLLSGAPIANDGILEVSEVAGSPVQRDTIRAEILDCSAAPCPTASAVMTGTSLRITDGQWSDLDLVIPPATISLEALDLSVYYDVPTTATVTSGGDAETVTLDPAWEDPVAAQFGRFRGSVPVEVGAAVPGDGYLQVSTSDVVTASRPDPLGLSSAVDTATVAGGLLAFLDRAGEPVDFVLLSGDVRVRAFHPSGNVSPSGADWINVEVISRDSFGNVRDTETLLLVETGIDTSTFVGQLPSLVSGAVGFYDGVLQTGPPYGTLDTVEATLDATTASATLRVGILRFVDVSGADVTLLPDWSAARLQLESDFLGYDTYSPDQVPIKLYSLASGDEEDLWLIETGADTSYFEGSLTTVVAAASPFDGLLQTQTGELVEARYMSYYFGNLVDQVQMGTGTPGNNPPNAVDDATTTADSTAVTLNVLANDSDPEGQALTVASFTQGAQGGAVYGSGGVLTFTPVVGFIGTDTFTYRLVDTQGGEDTATVTVTVELVNDPPIVYADYVSTPEDTAVTINPIANDSDPEGQALTLDFVFPSSLGTSVITDAAAGTLLYTPNLNATGTDTVVYRVRDAQGATSMGFVDVTMLPVNDPPVAVNDTATTAEDTLVSVFPLANDSDPDGDTIWISAPWPVAAHGQVGATATMFNYLPAANYNGTDTVTYTINDGNGRTATATVTITITPVPDPPVAATDNETTAEDTVLVVSPLGNDSDPDGDAFSILSVTTAFHGSLAINGDGTVTYTPVANYNGTDRFDYTIQDATGRNATGRVNITLTPVNDPPDAVNDSVSVDEDGSTTVFVKSNDSDPDGDLLGVQSVTQGAHGTVTMSNGLPFYVPAANYFGPDSFTYTLSDLRGGTDVATVTVAVNNVQDSPSASPDAATTLEDTPVVVSVLANDSDPDGNTLTVFAVTAAAQGTVTFTETTVRYLPNANYFGPDTFSYSVNDGTGRSVSGVAVSITVASVNDGPIAGNDAGTVAEDGSVTLSVLGNDGDQEGDVLAIVSASQGANGAVTFTASTVTYTPAANFHGADSFTYTIGDGNGGSATATVSITVTALNDAPTAANDSTATSEDTPVTIAVLANDTDVDGDAVIVQSATQGTRGLVVVNANGTVTYTPNANVFGSDSFTYTIRDTTGLPASASVTVTVAAVNDSPDAVNDSATTDEASGGVTISVLANDTDPDGNTLTVTAASTPAHGTASVNFDNTISYLPVASYSGADSFTYTISDGAATDSATVAIQVKDVLGRVALLGTHSVWMQTGSDLLSGDIVGNEAGVAPFLNVTEVSIAGGATTAAGWDVQGNRVTIATGAAVASDVYSNQLFNTGTVTGALYPSPALPIFVPLPTFLASAPGTTDVNVAANGTRTLAPGNYRDLIVGKRGVVTLTGGTYHFRTINLSGSEAKLYFSAASTIRVQQKIRTNNLAILRPATGASITAAAIVFHVAGINGTAGGLTEAPKAVEIGIDSTFYANLYVPNGSIWIKDRTVATGAYIGKDVRVGPDAQVSLKSAW